MQSQKEKAVLAGRIEDLVFVLKEDSRCVTYQTVLGELIHE